jgi:ribosome-associated toxin RatA of RatAB toxin-antitoxin module
VAAMAPSAFRGCASAALVGAHPNRFPFSRGRLRRAAAFLTIDGGMVMLVRIGAAAAAVLTALAGAPAKADGLTRGEAERLVRGATITRAQTLAQGGRRYVGGVTYTIVDARAQELSALVDDVSAWRRFLPKTRDVRHVGTAAGDPLIEVTHGAPPMQVSYTIRVHREPNLVRFWMDPARPHDIEDAWGFFRAEPLDGDRTLVTYGILIDMGSGLLRALFEDRVRELALTVPERVRGLLVERRAAEEAEPLVFGAGARY